MATHTGSRFPVWLLACLLAAMVGALGAGLQLTRFAAEVLGQFSTTDWWMIAFWSSLLFIWVFGLGLIGGVLVSRSKEKARRQEAPVIFPDV